MLESDHEGQGKTSPAGGGAPLGTPGEASSPRLAVHVPPAFAACELAEYLALLWPDVAQRSIRDLFQLARVRSRGKPAGMRRLAGDVPDLEIYGGLEAVRRIPLGPAEGGGSPGAPILPLEVLHEDARWIVFRKPRGLPVVPDRSRGGASVLGAAIARELRRREGAEPGLLLRPRIVHRLDRLTSGLVIVALAADVERRLARDFELRRVRKEYLALLEGIVAPARITVHCPVVPGRKGRMRAELREPLVLDRAPGSALTEFEVLERREAEGRTLVRARPRTGRTHQIRVHAWAAGHPIAGDPIYGRAPVAPGPARRADRPERAEPGGDPELLLHAWRYELPEDWEEPRAFECPPGPGPLELRRPP